MGALKEKFRRAREFDLPVKDGTLVLRVRRPADLEMVNLQSIGYVAGMPRTVIGWKRADGALPSEIDLGVENGDPHPLEFDADDFGEWVADQPEVFKALMDRVLAEVKKHGETQAATAKN